MLESLQSASVGKAEALLWTVRVMQGQPTATDFDGCGVFFCDQTRFPFPQCVCKAVKLCYMWMGRNIQADGGESRTKGCGGVWAGYMSIHSHVEPLAVLFGRLSNIGSEQGIQSLGSEAIQVHCSSSGCPNSVTVSMCCTCNKFEHKTC